MGRDAVQEPAVVAARHTATAEPLEPFLQGPQGIHVQVVGRFVEQQQIGPFLEHACEVHAVALAAREILDRKSTRLNSSHLVISYAVFCLKKKKESNLTVLPIVIIQPT